MTPSHYIGLKQYSIPLEKVDENASRFISCHVLSILYCPLEEAVTMIDTFPNVR